MKVSEFKTAGKLITGLGAIKALTDEMKRLGINNCAVITDKGVSSSGLLDQILTLIPSKPLLIVDDIPPEPEVDVIERKLCLLREKQIDGIIALGGGSAIDSAKVLASTYDYTGPLVDLFGENTLTQRNLPLIVVPTTAGTGSEVTNIAILSDPKAQMKKGIVSHCLLPDVAIVAPEMTKTCPPSITAASGIDAFVHALEAYISVNASPITDALAEKALKLIFNSLSHAYNNGENLSAREDMATGSLMAGLAFGNAGVGAVHALAYPLGGRFHLSHGMSNAVMLPHVLKVNAPFCQDKLYCVAKLLKVCERHHSKEEAVKLLLGAIEKLCRDVDIPNSLTHFNISPTCVGELAEEASKVTRLLRNNPKQLSIKEIEDIYRLAF
ncbi:iron-containing alcohol dehydrogenase [Alteromonas sp. BL110]|uniref:iron-containing alcohol dehydrogenase n=1 Tax=Alteromonas sp. BL110 TaxID=1714845 RepID=UPI000E4CF558|nr:iron-containing alcohol dehydrogenase [Alteromonas sp. BL110]AXT38247.1 iron-containing alcohol dehydrogenase [Alteromonas sp. BL110]RKM84009.1 iron-containing alcohol dehydrogenase [Alteromonas sp. BL110]